jgi:RNA polymerase sigma-70 factor (ECF subfamily)
MNRASLASNRGFSGNAPETGPVSGTPTPVPASKRETSSNRANVTPTDADLIAAFVAGQTDAFGALVVRYQQRLIGSLTGVLGSSEDACDVAQDAFVLAFQNLAAFRGGSAFYSWLYRIALNAAASRKRRRQHVTTSLDGGDSRLGDPPDLDPASQPDYVMEVDERRQLVRRALAELAEDFRTVLVLKEMDGLKYEEIAEIVGVPLGTVRSRIHRARLELRDRLSVLLRDPAEAFGQTDASEA